MAQLVTEASVNVLQNVPQVINLFAAQTEEL